MREILRRLLAVVTRPARQREVRAAAAAWAERHAEAQSQFLDIAGSAGKPRGMRWTGCEWTGSMRLARDRATGLLTAFAGIVVRFEPIEGGEMEGIEAAALPRDATAVFHYRDGRWDTGGRTLFNMTPDEAVERLAGEVEPIEIERNEPAPKSGRETGGRSSR